MIAIIGSGPAALMAAEVVSKAGNLVTVFEKRKSAGRKLLVAGSSGLNITHTLPLESFVEQYKGGTRDFWSRVIGAFPPKQWRDTIEGLGIPTFEGSAGRCFVEDMKASKFLRAWVARLQKQGVIFVFGKECTGFSTRTSDVSLEFSSGESVIASAVCFALGGGSWEPSEKPLRWPQIFKAHSLAFDEMTASNVGYRVAWPGDFLKEAEGLPLKNIAVTSSKGSRQGDAIITNYGIEGTPIYTMAETGTVYLDLMPDLSQSEILAKLQAVKENLSPLRRAKKQLNLCPATQALLFHCMDRGPDLADLASKLKKFPLELLGPQPMDEAISSAGGLRLTELADDFSLKKFPRVFAAGEMLSWDVPTGGFLIQGCVSQGYLAGQGMLKFT